MKWVICLLLLASVTSYAADPVSAETQATRKGATADALLFAAIPTALTAFLAYSDAGLWKKEVQRLDEQIRIGEQSTPPWSDATLKPLGDARDADKKHQTTYTIIAAVSGVAAVAMIIGSIATGGTQSSEKPSAAKVSIAPVPGNGAQASLTVRW